MRVRPRPPRFAIGRKSKLAMLALMVLAAAVIVRTFFWFCTAAALEPAAGAALEMEAGRTSVILLLFIGLMAAVVLGRAPVEVLLQASATSHGSRFSREFAAAVEELDAAFSPIRVAAASALVRSAHRSRFYRKLMVEVLSPFVRQNAPIRSAPAAPEARAKTAAGVRLLQEVLAQWEEDDRIRLDLSHTDLRGIEFDNAVLHLADLSGVQCDGARLSEGFLAGARLRNSALRKAKLDSADLSGAEMSGANLQAADLTGARLEGADLSGAQLQGAVLIGAFLARANLAGARLEGADLSGAIDLTRGQIASAVTDERTLLPEHARPERKA